MIDPVKISYKLGGSMKFYPEYMTKKKPKPPQSIFKNKFDKFFGIVSPSLYQMVKMGGKGRIEYFRLIDYEIEFLKYLCYKRKLTKKQWKRLYRDSRM